MRICGFEFRVGSRWVRLQGFGGPLGDGALGVLNDMNADKRQAFLERLLPNLLREAHRLDTLGALIEYRDVEDYTNRHKPIDGPVKDVRVRWSKA